MKRKNQLLIALALILLATGCTKKDEVVSVVTMDVNPSVELKLNKEDTVVGVNAINADSKAIINEMDLIGTDVNVAVNAVIGSMVKHGYLNNEQNTVLLSVSNDDVAQKQRLEKELSDEIYTSLNNHTISSAVVSQEVNKNTTLEDMVKTYDISLSKAALVNEVKNQKTTYKVEDLVKLSTQDLVLLNNKETIKGEVNKQQLITKEEALEVALKDAGLTKDEIFDLEVELDYERNGLTYEVDFDTPSYEYEYEIDAEDKTIYKADKPRVQNTTTSDPVITQPVQNNDNKTETKVNDVKDNQEKEPIGKDKALEIALENAGVKKEDAKRVEVEFDRDDLKYDVEFDAGTKEYDYEIAALTGKIIEKDVEMLD